MQKPKPPPQSSSSDEEEEVARNDNDAAADKWEQLLRNMLPAGAPLPDEDQLDYSIAVEYQGPPPQFSKIHSSNLSSFPKTSKFSSSFKNHRNPSSFCHRGNLISKACRNCSIDATGNSDLEIETSFSASSSTFSHLREISVDEVEFEGDDTESRVVKTKSKVCNRCKKGISLVFVRKRGMRCLVCDALYCLNCVLRAMGSMPEGRKCVGCIGKPIDEAKRDRLGKYSRLLARVCSPLEVRQIMKAEKECLANQIRPEQVVVNGRPLRAAELADILKCSIPHQNLRPGRYWYDKDSGLWGKEGEKPERIISAKLNVGAKLPVYASDGNTQVYINGREITKVELKVLRLLKVQCLPDTHFWLYEDGSYEEEGQNNIKGNIWAKAFNRLICSLFSLPVPPGNPHATKEDSTTFSARTVPEYLGHGEVQKLLLLGSEASGTSTIFKQVKFTYGNKFTAEELESIKLRIQSNIYRYLSVLLEGRECFEDEGSQEGKIHDVAQSITAGDTLRDGCQVCIYAVNERFKRFSDWLLNIMDSGDMDAIFPAATREYAPLVNDIWKDPAIQETYKRRDELCLPDVAKYFLDRAIEISSNDYKPTEEDILYAEGVIPINGLASLEFTSDDDHRSISETYMENYELQSPLTKYQLVRMGCKAMDSRCKWLEMFEGFRAVVYCVALTDYDQVCAKDTMSYPGNKMLASRDLFESLVRHTCFKETPFVLLLNKFDAFEDKIKRVPLTVCEWFDDFSPLESQSLAQQAYFYIAVKFKVLYTSMTGRKLFVWQTRAYNRCSVDEAFKYIKEVIRWNEEKKDTSVYGMTIFGNDDTFYSTDEI